MNTYPYLSLDPGENENNRNYVGYIDTDGRVIVLYFPEYPVHDFFKTKNVGELLIFDKTDSFEVSS
jgi:hypothetical protein